MFSKSLEYKESLPLCRGIELDKSKLMEEYLDMHTLQLETERLILRKFTEEDTEALYLLLKDEEVNVFLPWFPVKNMEAAKEFYRERFADQAYCFAICLKEDNYPIGYVKADMDDSHDFGYALRKEFWHQGIVTEASKALIEQLKQDGIPYITACLLYTSRCV